MALPDALQDAATRLPAAAARLTGVPDSGPPLDNAEFNQLEEMLSAFAEDPTHDTHNVDTLLSDDRLRLALLRLVAFSVRCSRWSCAGLAVCGALHAGQALLIGPPVDAPSAWRARTRQSFARKLLRMDTLQCCSRAFSKSAAVMQTTAAVSGSLWGGTEYTQEEQTRALAAALQRAGLQAPQGAVGPPAVAAAAAAAPDPGRDAAELAGLPAALATKVRAQVDCAFAVHHLTAMGGLISTMLSAASMDAGAVGPGFTARQAQQVREQRRLYARELATALRSSCMLEHYARWALHVQLAEASGRVVGLRTRSMHVVATQLFDLATSLADTFEDDDAAARALRAVLSGPCMRHLALSMGLVALCAADGGPSHGLPPELLLRLPILGGAGQGPHGAQGPADWQDVRGAHGLQRLQSRVFLCMLRALGDSSAASTTPPRDWRTVVGLLRRIGSLVLASARAWADEGAAEAEAGPQPPPLQLVLGTNDVPGVALRLLQQFQRCIGGWRAAGASGSAALAGSEAAWWRMAVDLTPCCARWAVPEALRQLAELLSLDPTSLYGATLTADGPLPASPPCAVAAALAGGLLPLWERLLRCAGRDPECPEAALLVQMLGKPFDPEAIVHLLAYGGQRQGAALVATWAKLLRALAVPQLLSGLGGGAEDAAVPRSVLAQALAAGACRLMLAAPQRLAEAGRRDPAAVDPSPPQLQLARLLSYAVCEWLPPLARLIHDGLLAIQRAESESGQSVAERSEPQVIGTAIPAVLRLLLVLLLRSGADFGQAAVPAAEAVREMAPAVVGAPPALPIAPAPAAASWRQVLLQQVGAVPLLGVLCQFVLWRAAAGDSVQRTFVLLKCCCDMAVACPEEVRQAALAAAAEAAAGAGSSSGRGRAGGAGTGGRRWHAGRDRGGGPMGPEAALPSGWSSPLFKCMAAYMRSHRNADADALARVAAALAAQVEQWVAGGGEDGAWLVWAVAVQVEATYAAAAQALAPSPAEARAVLRTCSNPACDNLAGDSEAELRLRACGRCGGAWYCRQECLAAHWRTGHREACTGR